MRPAWAGRSGSGRSPSTGPHDLPVLTVLVLLCKEANSPSLTGTYYPGTEEAQYEPDAPARGVPQSPRSRIFDVSLLWTGFITRPGIPWGNCYG